MTFQRIAIGLFVVLAIGLGAAYYIDWRLGVQVRTMKAFVESYVFAEAVAACEKAPSSTPFKWNGANSASIRLRVPPVDSPVALSVKRLFRNQMA